VAARRRTPGKRSTSMWIRRSRPLLTTLPWSWSGVPIIQMPPGHHVRARSSVRRRSPKFIIGAGVETRCGGSMGVVDQRRSSSLLREGHGRGATRHHEPVNRDAIQCNDAKRISRARRLLGRPVDRRPGGISRIGDEDRVMRFSFGIDYTHEHVLSELRAYDADGHRGGQYLIVADRTVAVHTRAVHPPVPGGPGKQRDSVRATRRRNRSLRRGRVPQSEVAHDRRTGASPVPGEPARGRPTPGQLRPPTASSAAGSTTSPPTSNPIRGIAAIPSRSGPFTAWRRRARAGTSSTPAANGPTDRRLVGRRLTTA